MPTSSRLKSLYKKLGWPEKLALVLLVAYGVLALAAPNSLYLVLTRVVLIFSAVVVGFRLVRTGIRKAIWRLRNRLIVAYLFIAFVPVALILVLVGIGAYLLTGQIAVHLVTTELHRRTEELAAPTQGMIATPPQLRTERIRWMAPYFQQRYPGLELLVKGGGEWIYPAGASIATLPGERSWADTAGVVLREGRLYLWSHAVSGSTEALMMAPLTGDFLDALVPNLGQVRFLNIRTDSAAAETPRENRRNSLPPPVSRFDVEVSWFAATRVDVWESGETESWQLTVTSRPSAVLRTLFGRSTDYTEGLAWLLFLLVATLFLLVELISLFIGVSMSRTVTGAVHDLYEGTHRVMAGDFSHRIEVQGNDQLAEVNHSFNRMTENLERLVRVEKEKERLQSELEIAREVQGQLYPKTVPAMKHMELNALCHPARTVSGDYYDYLSLRGSQVALAIGDVAGKGISAALLMATVQATLRTQVRACLESAAAASASGESSLETSVPTSRLVSQLNQQLYAYTSAEKFATFYFGVYDERTGMLTYTNAGHPPPILVRNGEALRLETNGMVVGAFPFSQYEESSIELVEGDLLVCFTDGITEPENEYGEMFGEDGLTELLLKNSWRKPADIIASVIATVQQWTNSPELQDDMTLLLAKRV